MTYLISKRTLLLCNILFFISVQVSQAQWDDLIEEVEKQRSADPNNHDKVLRTAHVYSDIARDLDNHEKYEEAIHKSYEAFKDALEINPNSTEAQEGLTNLQPISINNGVAAYKNGDMGRALEAFMLAQEIEGKEDLTASLYAVQTARQIQDYDSYAESMEKLLSQQFDAKAEYYAEYISYHSNLENYDDALEILDRSLHEYPKHETLQDLKIVLFIKTGKYIEIIDDLKAKLQVDDNDSLRIIHYHELGVVYETLGRGYDIQSQDTTLLDEEVADLENQAFDYYMKAIDEGYLPCYELDFSHVRNTYNLSSVYYNLGVHENDSINKVLEKERPRKKVYEKMIENRDTYFYYSLSYFEYLYDAYYPVVESYEENYLIDQLDAMQRMYKILDREIDQPKRAEILQKLLPLYEERGATEDIARIQSEINGTSASIE